MNNLAAYLPQDRRHALAQNAPLPDRATGSVLFVDISGFTPFTASLRHAYGSRRGAEELGNHLNAVYTALIAEVERFGGSVTGFAGDAITCWFAEADGSAVACAVALQTAMQAFAEIPLPQEEMGRLRIKVGVAMGEVRRLVVGDEGHYWLDVLAGETVDRTAVAEQLATAPEILLDEATVAALGEGITLAEWRTSEETGERFGVLGEFRLVVATSPPMVLPELVEEATRPWLNPLVYAREKTGHALLQTDFRPCVALFVRFVGINYDTGTAADQLNQFVCPLQAILARYEGTLIDLTFGDKGSYAYINFGALSIHEDDARRAVKTALNLREVAQTLSFLEPLQIGITSGVMRTGAYGGGTRRHYGALGEAVNVAARLMSTAVGGEIIVSEAIYRATQSDFFFEPHPPLLLRGKTDPIHTYRLTATQAASPLPLHEPNYTLPMVGRQAELATINEKLALAAGGVSQLVSLVGEAGLGKSRLAAESVQIAQGNGFVSYGGACQADGLNTPYLVWKPIWRRFFGLEAPQEQATQIAQLTTAVRRYAPEREASLPLLAPLLDLPIPENDWTKPLEPKVRQTALHALLEACLRQACQVAPRLILIEDLHWIDALSHDLLEELAKSLSAYPLFFLLVYRPTQLPRLQAPRLEARPNFTSIPLAPLDEAEATQIIRAKLAQLYPVQEGQAQAISAQLVQKLLARAEGNPFYLEELLNFLHGRGVDPSAATSWETDLPESLHALILSRIDQLQAHQKRLMRVASVIGRLFPVKWLVGYYPNLGELPQVQADLAELHTLDLTLLDSSEPELAYLFKHIITHEVTYESLPFATRARLHEQLAAYLETVHAPPDSIAYHYGRSDNERKKRHYWHMAGNAAQANFAHESALAYYEQLLPLLSDEKALADIYLQQGTVLERLARFAEAETAYQTGLTHITSSGDPAAIGQYQLALGRLSRLQGRYDDALRWLDLAQTSLSDSPLLAEVLTVMGVVWWFKQELDKAQTCLEQSLALAQANDALAQEAAARFSLGNIITLGHNDYVLGEQQLRQALALWRQLGDKWGIAGVLNNLGLLAYMRGDMPTARVLFQESLDLKRAMGDKGGMSNTLLNLGNVAYHERDYAGAEEFYVGVLQLRREMENRFGIAQALNNVGLIRAELGQFAKAQAGHEEALALAYRLADNLQIGLGLFGLARLGLSRLTKEGRDEALLETTAVQLRGSLEAYQQLKEAPTYLLSTLVGVARLAVWHGKAQLGARLLGAEAAILAASQLVRLPMVANLYEETHTAVFSQLPPAELETAWAEGAAMSLEEAITDALAYTEKKQLFSEYAE